MNIGIEKLVLGEGDKGELDGSSKAAGVGYVHCLAYFIPIQFRKAVDEIMRIAFCPEVGGEVDNAKVVGEGRSFFEEFPALAVGGAKEEDVDIIQGNVASAEYEVCFSFYAGMNAGDGRISMAVAVDEGDFRAGVVYE
jgi:hypothetical protein